VNLVLRRCRELLHWQAGWVAVLAAMTLTWIGIHAIETADMAAHMRANNLAVSPTSHRTVGAVTVRTNWFSDRQLVWVAISMVGFAVCLLPHPRQIGLAAPILFAATLALLVLLIAPGVPESIVRPINGARSWINLRVMNVQPSELAKITAVLALAWYLRYRSSHRAVRGLIVPFLIMFVPVMLILRQPDLGTALLFAPALLAMLVAAGAKMRHLAAVLFLAVAAVAVNVAVIFMLPDSMQILRRHQRGRIKAIVSHAQGDPRYDNTINYQKRKAMTLIGSGGVLGYGSQRSATMVRFNRLPYDHNDMIFALIVNRWGALGGLATIGLFGVLVLSIVVVASRARDPFMRLTLVGFAATLFSQAAINIAITLGLMPVTGITLPFVSYGGSSLLTSFATMGLVVNIGSRRSMRIARPSFEYDVLPELG